MKVKTSELIGPALDWAVAKCNGRGLDLEDPRDPWLTCGGIADQPLHSYTPHTDWAQGGPIIEREGISGYWDEGNQRWDQVMHEGRFVESGPTKLIAAMRCYVASKLGNEIDVPEELI